MHVYECLILVFHVSIQIYNSSSLRLRLIGPPLLVSGRRTRKKSGEDDEVISCLGCKGDLTFAAIGSKIIECKRIHRRGVYTLYGDTGSDDQIVEMMVLGSRILGRTAAGCIAVWHIGEYGEPVSECWPKTEADGVEGKATCMAHPHTYLNKVLVGMSNGAMQLWNFSTNKMIYEFEAFDSSVVCIEPSLALDVVGVGLASGMVVLKDIKKNVTLLELDNASGAGTKADMFLSNSVDSIHHRSMSSGSCGCIAFGMSQSLPLMATGGASGVISVWNLETQTLHAIIRDAHDGSLSKLEFLDGHPILVSTADDNSIKEWIFDGTDGQPRLLRFRSGHASPPTIVRHYADSTKLLSGGQDRAFRFFSTVQDAQSREISQGHVQRRAKKLKITEQELKLTRIVSLDACDVRERDWSNVITAHENDTSAYVWRIQKFAQGEFVLRPPRVNNENLAPVSSVCLSRCGNFGFVGSSSGRIDRYNMQSGLHRGTYQCSGGYSAHAGAVSGLACDGCNRYLVSGGLDSMMKCWNMKTRKLQGEMDLGSKIGKIAFHPTTCLVAVACDDGVIRLCDVEAMTIVRRFKGHSDRITDIQFSQDCRWLLSASMDSTLRIWDVPGRFCEFNVCYSCTGL
jgi:U3 small nucleolar RNA-associated protein 21